MLKQSNFFQFDVYVVEQDDGELFNRGKLLNIGATIAEKRLQDRCGGLVAQTNLCLIFHDVDMIPINKQIPYSCTFSPVLLATAAQQFGYKLPYPHYFGGAVAISWDHFVQFNGFSNRFWGWGGEDDDLYLRVRSVGLKIFRLPSQIGRFKVVFLLRYCKYKNLPIIFFYSCSV